MIDVYLLKLPCPPPPPIDTHLTRQSKSHRIPWALACSWGKKPKLATVVTRQQSLFVFCSSLVSPFLFDLAQPWLEILESS